MDVIEAIRKPRHRVSLYVNTRYYKSSWRAALTVYIFCSVYSARSRLMGQFLYVRGPSIYLSVHVKSSYLVAGYLQAAASTKLNYKSNNISVV